MVNKTEDWLFVGIMAFVGGVVTNIIVPVRRGLWGFFQAAIIGVFCGFVAALLASEMGASVNVQRIVAGCVGVLGDRLLSWVLKSRLDHQVIVHGGVNQINQGQSVNGEQN